MDKTVTLSVDGETHEVRTLGTTVEDVLSGQDIEVTRHDAVSPPLDSTVEDGSRVSFRYGRPLTLTVDGERRTHWVTATRVGNALAQIGRPFTGAELSTSRSAPVSRKGLDLTVKTKKRVTLVVGGRTAEKVTTGVTAGEALRDLNVDHDRDDEVTPRPRTRIDDGSRIRVVSVNRKTRRVTATIPNETVVRYDDDLLEGRERVLRPGRDGVSLDTYKVVLADGEQRRRTRVSRDVRRAPVARVEVHGTKDATSGEISDAPCASGSAVEDGLTAHAIAVHRAVCARYPQVDAYGGLRPGDTGEHGTGRALDIMVSDAALGDAIAAFVRANHAALGVSEVIWSQQIWTTERSSEGWRSMEDRGSVTANHYDHVHVTVR